MNCPSNRVLDAFHVAQELKALDGGEGRCWHAGEVILKPCDDLEFWTWMGIHLPMVKADGFRLPLPIAAVDGAWVVDGWCAIEAVEGDHPKEGRWAEVIAIGERFHEAAGHLQRPSFIDQRTDPWSLGDRVAWEEAISPFESERLTRLLEMREPVLAPSQFIHGDLTENILFANGYDPAVIDVSPYWRPVAFATAIVVADAVCWCQATPEVLIQAVAQVDQFSQYLIRALIYRMVTTLATHGDGPWMSGYDPGIDLLMKIMDGS